MNSIARLPYPEQLLGTINKLKMEHRDAANRWKREETYWISENSRLRIAIRDAITVMDKNGLTHEAVWMRKAITNGGTCDGT